MSNKIWALCILLIAVVSALQIPKLSENKETLDQRSNLSKEIQLARKLSCPSSLGRRSNCFDATALGFGCICFVQINKLWDGANKFCKNQGMELVSVQSEAKNNLLLRLRQSLTVDRIGLVPPFWWTSGAETGINTNEWVWSATGEPFNYTNWGLNQPDGWVIQGKVALFNMRMNFFDWFGYGIGFFICEVYHT